MAHLDRDSRGYAIPVTVYRDAAGRAHFTINEEAERQRIIAEDRCPICGGKLLRGRWSVGGPSSAFHEHGAYLDPPMHRECAEYALKTCPYLAAPRYVKRVDAKTLPKGEPEPVTIDPTINPERPPLFVAVMHIGQTFVRESWGVRYIRPKRPYRQATFWRHGQMIDAAEGMAEAMAVLARLEETAT